MPVDLMVRAKAVKNVVLAKHGSTLERACWREVEKGNLVHTDNFALCQRFVVRTEKEAEGVN